jgi:hypothetical protein
MKVELAQLNYTCPDGGKKQFHEPFDGGARGRGRAKPSWKLTGAGWRGLTGWEKKLTSWRHSGGAAQKRQERIFPS